jgi:uncharacterized membrane protein YccF (DUF307 family)
MLSFMFLAYAGFALIILFGITAIFTSIIHKDGKHDWVPTRTGGIMGGIALILFLLAGIWLAVQSFVP